jgi:2-methylcitrate dehydratase
LIPAIRAHAEQFSGRPTATFVGGGRASVDQAAFFNAVLVRYPDLLDTYLTPGGLCHPADNFGAVFAVAEHVDAAGADFLLALAVAYEVQCRFSAEVPVMARGLNHALQLAISSSAGSAKLLGLDASRTSDAIAASAVDNVSLAAVHAEPVSTWKGISPAITGMRAVYATMLASRGVTGPRALFEGPNGLEQLFDQPIDLRASDRSLTAVEQTYLKQYCSLIHGQVVIDATLALRDEHGIAATDVAAVTLEVFQGAFDIAGGGRYGNKDHPSTKEQADYNLKYLVAVALLDGQVGPEQLESERIRRDDVQELLARVKVEAAADLTEAYPARTQARVRIVLQGGREVHREQSDFEGSPTNPMSWDRVVEKFHWLAEPFAAASLRGEIIDAVARLDEIPVAELAALLADVSPVARRPRSRARL